MHVHFQLETTVLKKKKLNEQQKHTKLQNK